MNTKTAVIILAIAFVLSGLGYLLTHQFKSQGINHVIKGTSAVSIDIWLDHVTVPGNKIFKTDEYANLIIRNRPHGKLKILDYKCQKLDYNASYLKKMGILLNKKTGMEPPLFQCKVTLQDSHALNTANGYVSHGNQLKIGNMITIEGKKYIFKGEMIDIYVSD